MATTATKGIKLNNDTTIEGSLITGEITASGHISGSSISTGSFGKVQVGARTSDSHHELDVTGEIGLTEDLHLLSNKKITWQHGDASIQEGTNGNGSLTFKTWNGSSSTTALILGCDTSITASGDISSSLNSTASFGRVDTKTGFFEAGSKISDYVFEPDYKLRTLNEVEQHISESKHLPGIPSEKEIEKWRNLSMGERDRLLLEKIEELTIYVLDLQRQIDDLKNK
tara:strand:- start:627 stop:1307 length:681 start_codon:yes stop_codon:yes gene_type:complete